MDQHSDTYRYLHHEMSAQERQQFEERMESDPQFKKHVEMEYTIIQGIEAYGSQKFKERVAQEIQSHRRGEKRRRFLWLIAMIIALAGLIGYLMTRSTNETPITPEKLYAEHFEAPALSSGQRSTGTTDLESSIRSFYHENHYSEIISNLRTMDPGQLSAEMSMMLGISYLENGDPNLAINAMSMVDESDTFYHDHKEWFTALAYIKSGQLVEASSILSEIIKDEQHDHYQDAKKLIGQLGLD